MTTQETIEEFRDEFYKEDDALFDRAGNNVSRQLENFLISALSQQQELILLKGTPEILISRLVRHSHPAKNCPHKGNCLTEEEMIKRLNELLKNLILQEQERIEKIIENEFEKGADEKGEPEVLPNEVSKVNQTLSNIIKAIRK